MAAPNADDDANISRGLLGRLSDDIAFISSLFALQDSKGIMLARWVLRVKLIVDGGLTVFCPSTTSRSNWKN